MNRPNLSFAIWLLSVSSCEADSTQGGSPLMQAVATKIESLPIETRKFTSEDSVPNDYLAQRLKAEQKLLNSGASSGRFEEARERPSSAPYASPTALSEYRPLKDNERYEKGRLQTKEFADNGAVAGMVTQPSQIWQARIDAYLAFLASPECRQLDSLPSDQRAIRLAAIKNSIYAGLTK